MPQGTLFTEDFLNEGIRGTETWRTLSEGVVEEFRAALLAVFSKVANPHLLNEAQTEERIIRPILAALGWSGCYSVQERAEEKGRANVPDYLLFGTPQAFSDADGKKSPQRYPLATAIADAKAWAVNFDQRGAGAASGETSSGQIIRYLTRADVLSNSAVLWGILTSGRSWRLYYQRAKSRLEDYFEIDLAWALSLPGTQGELQLRSRPPSFSSDEEYAEHLVTLMWVMFRREAFLPDSDGRTFHELALAEGRNWEARVRESLAGVVFGEVFPTSYARSCGPIQRAQPLSMRPISATFATHH